MKTVEWQKAEPFEPRLYELATFLVEFTKKLPAQFEFFIVNFASSVFLPSLSQVQAVFIGFRLSSSNFCQVQNKFKTQPAFFELEFCDIYFSSSSSAKKDRVQRVRDRTPCISFNYLQG